jgi:DNA-binding LacI/PurR family transcriptional regulator
MKKTLARTIDEIALSAGVSKATVSRVVNGSAPVSPDTREKVEAIMKANNYRPNLSARSLAGGGNGMIALVLDESTEEFFLNTFWKSVVQGFVEVCTSEGFYPILLFHSEKSSDRDLIATLMQGQLNAIAIFGWHRDIDVLERYMPKNSKVVFGGKQGESKRFTYAGVDNIQGGALATEHLISKGCKKILMITGDLSVVSARERLTGYERTLKKYNIPVDKNKILNGDYTQVGAEKAIEKFLQRKEPFDGIFASNDVMAKSVVDFLATHKLLAGTDYKIIGFDGSDIATRNTPSITTVAQPSQLLGETVARQLIEKNQIYNVQLPLEIVQGVTT